MDYKKKIDEIKAMVFGEDAKVEKLADEAKPEKEKEEVAAPQYVTLEQFNALKDEQEKFVTSVTEMLSKVVEMINATEKNTVPTEMKKEEEKEVELAADEAKPLVHDPESLQRGVVNQKISQGRRKTTTDHVMERLFGEGADTSIFN